MPFVNSSLSRIGSDLIDGGLKVSTRANVGRSILIIGTSSDGPVNVPTNVSDIGGLRKATDVFGPVDKGSLLHTAIECQNANQSGKDIRLLRISDGNLAVLNLKEVVTSGTTANLESYNYSAVPTAQFENVLVLQALYPGQIYNQVSVRHETGDGVDHLDSNYIVIYNPKTGVESWISYDYLNFTTDVDVHTVQELADAINADSNLNTVLQASVKQLVADYTLKVSDPGIGGNYSTGAEVDTNGFWKLTLSSITPIYITSPSTSGIDDVTVTGGAANVPTTGNLIKEFIELYELKEKQETLTMKGRSNVELAEIPIKGSSAAGTETLIKYIDRPESGEYGTPQIIFHYRNQLIDTIENDQTFSYTFTSPVCPDDSINQKYYDGSDSAVVDNSLEDRSVLSGDFSTFALKATRNNYTYTIPSGLYKVDYTPGTDTVTITLNGPSDSLSGYLTVGTVLTADYDTVVEDLSTEAASRTSILNSNNWHNYFVSGKTLTFGTSLPADCSIRYRYKNILEENADYVVASSSSSSRNDQIRFLNLDTQPSISGATDTSPARLGLNYYYDPQWIDVSTVKTLSGGTDGITMTNFRKYELLKETFDAIKDYPVGIVVLAETYADDTKVVYGADDGLPVTINAGFHTLFHSYLEALTGSTSETIGIMGVKQATGNTPTAVTSWVNKLVNVDPTDPNRAANHLSSFGSKYLTIVAMEPVFSNEAAFVPYVGTGEGLYAGLLATLPVNTSPTNKQLSGITGFRYLLSGGVNGQLDKLTGARYVTGRLNQAGTPVVTSGITFASPGSDYQREMTRNMVFQVMALIRAVCEPYLGEGNSVQVRNAMHTAINAALQRLVELNPPALQAFDFEIISTPDDQVLGLVNIDLTLVPVFELREIRVTVKLRAEL